MGRSRKTVDFLVSLNRYRDVLFKALGVPVLGTVLKRVMDARGTVFIHIPVGESLEVGGGTALPVEIAEHFIREACHHVILEYCPCRKVKGCKEHNVNTGCIFIGAGAREIDPRVGRHVSAEDALGHLRAAAASGLVPVVGKVKFDADYLGVKDHRRLMTVCNCCACCCLAGGVRQAPRDVRDLVVRLEGVEVSVESACVGCGTCVGACIFNQVEVVEGRAVIGEECKGCGRCAAACPNNAITVRVENPDYTSRCVELIGAYVDTG